MDTDYIKKTFEILKPICDFVMILPSANNIKFFLCRIDEFKKEAVQALQQYIMFPFITHLKSTEMEKQYELQCRMVDAVCHILDKVTVNSCEMTLQIEHSMLNLIFDKSKSGMIAEVPEELKLSVMKCLTVLMANLHKKHRITLLKTKVPLLAQAVFLSIQIAKQEKHRGLRLAALYCLMAHTSIHPNQTDCHYGLTDPEMEELCVDMLSNILPGVMAALQDVANCKENPGHAVVVAALEATHRILCLTMNDKHLPQKSDVTTQDLANLLTGAATKNKEVRRKVLILDKSPAVSKRSPEWYSMAGGKLVAVTEMLVGLRAHEHQRVRRELAVYCDRLIEECSSTMRTSVPLCLDVLVCLSKDEYTRVSAYSVAALRRYLARARDKDGTMAAMCDNLIAALEALPGVMNNIDSNRKLSALNLIHGYLELLCDSGRPQRLTLSLSTYNNMAVCCRALRDAAAIEPLASMEQCTDRDVSSPAPSSSPWLVFRQLSPACAARLRAACGALARAECGDLVLDALLHELRTERSPATMCVVNWMAEASDSPSFINRILDTYLDEELWYLPLDVDSGEVPVTSSDTCDVTVYNPRAWTTDRVPGLYESGVSARYTGVSYSAARAAASPGRAPVTAQRHLLLSCLSTAGVGAAAIGLGGQFRPHLMRTLGLLLERVGSKYELLHLSGLKALNEVAAACGHRSVAGLVRDNADYFTSQVTNKLKKPWTCESALQILTVVMEYSDDSMLNCLYGIVEDVLVQSCDKYHENNLESYLQVFLTFVKCLTKFFSPGAIKKNEKHDPHATDTEINILKDVEEYVKNTEEAERLMNEEMDEDAGKSGEQMYREDERRKEEEMVDYDDRVTEEKQPPPQHVAVTVTVLKRCINFIPSPRMQESIRAMEVLTAGLPVLSEHEDCLLPLVHQAWAPLVTRFATPATVMRRALTLLVTMATLAKQFICRRTVKEVLPQIYAYLKKSATNSYLKDKGSSYRNSQAFQLQLSALAALSSLAVHLGLEDQWLDEAMDCVDAYLSNKQPKPLQELAVKFFKDILDYDNGAAWYHLRKLCANDDLLPAPSVGMELESIVGTPYRAVNKDYENNIKLIFERESEDI